jgi:hypothetical protein
MRRVSEVLAVTCVVLMGASFFEGTTALLYASIFTGLMSLLIDWRLR